MPEKPNVTITSKDDDISLKSNIELDDELNPPFVNDADSYYKKTRAVPTPEKNIGVDVENKIIKDIIETGEKSQLDISQLEEFTTISRSRNQVYDLIDSMCTDPMISAAVETYAEDATETNEDGRIVWSESENANINAYIMYLLDSMNVDKHIFTWVKCLVKYGDCYLKLYRASELEDGLFDDEEEHKKEDGRLKLIEELRSEPALNEDVKVQVFGKNDRFSHYVEMVRNPAEVYELIKFGKTYAYIVAPTPRYSTQLDDASFYNYRLNKFNFKKKDVKLYQATEFVHATINENPDRYPEEVSIYRSDLDYESETNALTYTVNRGQSLLYNTFKIWRELTLLENSLMLNRITKSSVVRIFNVEVGDMPKENINPHLRGIKSLVEQKSAINAGNAITEYVNPGPMENNIYLPSHGGQGAINIQSFGGDVDVKGIADIDYFKTKMYGSLRIPKQYLGDTDDSTGFNGGSSLSLISSRYAKAIKRIQNTMIQALTDAINLMLLDKGLNSYINKFTLHMVSPTTQEEVDRISNMQNELNICNDVMNMLEVIEDPYSKLVISKALLSTVITNPDIMKVIQDQIEALQELSKKGGDAFNPEGGEGGDEFNFSLGGGGGGGSLGGLDFGGDEFDLGGEESSTESEGGGAELPSPSDLGVDMTATGSN